MTSVSSNKHVKSAPGANVKRLTSFVLFRPFLQVSSLLKSVRPFRFGFKVRGITTLLTPTTMPPANWKAKAPLSLPGPTFAAQAKLQKLPVPELEQTLRKIKESLKPIAHSEEEYNATVVKVDDFARGLAPKLHERLLKRRDDTDHWLEEWWDNDAYLAYRDSVVVNVSYFCEPLT